MNLNLLVGCFISGQISINDGMDNHDDNDDVERVEKPVVNHFVVSGLGNHFDNGALHCGYHHHDCYGDHNPVLHKYTDLDQKRVLVLTYQENVHINVKLN